MSSQPPDELAHWRDRILAEFADRFEGRRLQQAEHDAASLFAYLERCGVTRLPDVTGALTQRWAWSPEIQDPDDTARTLAPGSVHRRRWHALESFKTAARLGAPVDPLAAAGPRIRVVESKQPSSRPLTGEELLRVRDAATPKHKSSKHRLLVAFASAGGTPMEVAAVRAMDVDLAQRAVRFTARRSRVCALDAWGLNAVEEHLRANPVPPGVRLCSRADMPLADAAHSVTTRLATILAAAGISDRDGVEPGSIRLTAGRAVLEHKGIEAAAAFLGLTLDRAARVLRHRWQHAPTPASTGTGASTDA